MSTSIAALPFPYTANVQLVGGQVVGEVRMAVWPARSHRAGRAGRYFDHEGEAQPEAWAMLRRPNLQLEVVNGPYVGLYKIADVQAHLHGIPHLALELVKSGKLGRMRNWNATQILVVIFLVLAILFVMVLIAGEV